MPRFRPSGLAPQNRDRSHRGEALRLVQDDEAGGLWIGGTDVELLKKRQSKLCSLAAALAMHDVVCLQETHLLKKEELGFPD